MSLPEILEPVKDLVKSAGLMKPNRVVAEIDPDKVVEAFERLRSAYGDTGIYLSNIIGTDFKNEGKIRVDYYVNVFTRNQYVVLRTYIPRDDPKIESMLLKVPAALSGECETYDLLGVVFEGNPHLKRAFFVPTEVAEKGVFPLRKDSGV